MPVLWQNAKQNFLFLCCLVKNEVILWMIAKNHWIMTIIMIVCFSLIQCLRIKNMRNEKGENQRY